MPEMLRQLKAIGNNLNQIARAANSGFQAPPVTREIQEEVDLLWQLLKP
ncbi:MAG: MobC family plasmid mobilization relaxosome protein [Selenomonas sp.]|nr:MobC family plasmid mobilization relaxosome protein [Selenomonas sp.]